MCDKLRCAPGEPLCITFEPFSDFRVGVVGPGQTMDVYFTVDERYLDIRVFLRCHMAELADAATVLQSAARMRLVRHCLLPDDVLAVQIALASELGRLDIDSSRHLVPANLYLHPVEGNASWVYCDRATGLDVVDPLTLLRPRPTLLTLHASSATKRRRQLAAYESELCNWDRWRVTLSWSGVTYFHGRLYRPRQSPAARDRFEAAMATRDEMLADAALEQDARRQWLQAGRDEASFAHSWAAWLRVHPDGRPSLPDPPPPPPPPPIPPDSRYYDSDDDWIEVDISAHAPLPPHPAPLHALLRALLGALPAAHLWICWFLTSVFIRPRPRAPQQCPSRATTPELPQDAPPRFALADSRFTITDDRLARLSPASSSPSATAARSRSPHPSASCSASSTSSFGF